MRKFISILFLAIANFTLMGLPAEASKPTAPTEFLAITSLQIPGSVELSWRAVKGASEYTVSAARETTDYWHILDTTAATSFQVTELPEGTKYYFRIASNNRAGQSGWSDEVVQYSSKSQDLRPVLLLPANFRIGASGAVVKSAIPSQKGELALAWNAVAGAKSYVVQICESKECGATKPEVGSYSHVSQDVYFRDLATVVGTDHVVTGLQSGKLYRFRIMGIDDQGKQGAHSVVQGRNAP